MIFLGVTQLNEILKQREVEFLRDSIINAYENNRLNNESNYGFYKNSFGSQLQFEEIHDVLTQRIIDITGLNITKSNNYSRIYFNDSALKPHVDRNGLDLTLSVQLENTFKTKQLVFAKGYDGTVYNSELKNGDGVLLHGRELEHWRDDIHGGGRLVCTFFHWQVNELIHKELGGFLSIDECDGIIDESGRKEYAKSLVNKGGVVEIDEMVRSNCSQQISLTWIDDRLKHYINNLSLEGWSLLRYENGQKFTPHFDGEHQGKKRLYTIMIYLNEDYVGGETNFPTANIKVKPKTGKCFIWKNFKSNEIDPLSLHEGCEVESGVKYALVNWVLM